MTPSQIMTVARQRYNALGDDFWSDQEIYDMIYHASLELANECTLIERTFTTSSVTAQQEYDFPTNAIAIKRVTYNGRKLAPFSFREDDALTYLNQSILDGGSPTNYAVFENTFYLRPIPAVDGDTIKVFAYVQPQAVTSSSVIEIPSEFHLCFVNYILSEMNSKNKNYEGAQYYRNLWEKDIARIKKASMNTKTGDAFRVVKNVDVIPQTSLGNI